MRNLSTLYAPSGRERPVAEYLENALKDYVDTSSIDTMNNYVGIKKGKNAKKTILIDVHTDEVARKEPEKIIFRKEGNLISGKALDDRSGCAAMIAVARELASYDDLNVIYVGASREERGMHMRGAKKVAKDIAGRGMKVDLAIAFDVVNCYDGEKKSNKLGQGVTIMKRQGAFGMARDADRNALDLCYNVAETYGGKCQTSTYKWLSDLWTTDARQYHDLAKASALVVSIPCLNMHGYSSKTGLLHRRGGTLEEKIDTRDLTDTVRFTAGLAKAYARK